MRFHRADLPFETSQAIYDRMKSERQREAKELRAQGYEWAQQIQSKADRERTVVLSEAQRAGDDQPRRGRRRGEPPARRSLWQGPKFYQLYRSLQTYKRSLADSGPTLLLSPDASFLRTMTAGPDAAEPAASASAK